MTPQKQAADLCAKYGVDFTRMLLEHLDESSYIHSTPDCFVLAVDAIRDFGDNCHQEAIFVTIGVGNAQDFIEVDPRKETRKWMGYCRNNTGKVHWVDYQRFRRMLAKRPLSQN